MQDFDLTLKMDDDFRQFDFSTTEGDYPDLEDDLTNEVRIRVLSENKIVGYMEFVLFYNRQVMEDGGSFEYIADGLCQGSFEAMHELCARGVLRPPKKGSDNHVSFMAGVTVYLRYLAVREDFRRKGLAAWLLRNLPKILQRNYRVEPWLTVASIEPQVITWGDSEPDFKSPTEERPADKEMHEIMARLLEAGGYKRIDKTNHYVLKEAHEE